MEPHTFGIRLLPLFEAPKDNGSDDDTDSDKPEDSDPPQDDESTRDDSKPPRKFEDLKQEAASTADLAKSLFEQNQQLIKDRKRATDARKEVQGELETYRSIGSPEELKKAKERAKKADEYEQRVQEQERKESVREAAEVVGFNAKILNDQLSDDVRVEVRDDDGDKKAVVIEGDGDDETETELQEYAEQNLSDYMPVLQGSSQQNSAAVTGRTFPGQRSNDKKRKKGSTASSVLNRRYARKKDS